MKVDISVKDFLLALIEKMSEEDSDTLEFDGIKVERDAIRYRLLRGDAPSHTNRWNRFRIEVWTGVYWEPLEHDSLDKAVDELLMLPPNS